MLISAEDQASLDHLKFQIRAAEFMLARMPGALLDDCKVELSWRDETSTQLFYCFVAFKGKSITVRYSNWEEPKPLLRCAPSTIQSLAEKIPQLIRKAMAAEEQIRSNVIEATIAIDEAITSAESHLFKHAPPSKKKKKKDKSKKGKSEDQKKGESK